MNRLLPLMILIAMFLSLEGCKNPFSRTKDPDGGPTGASSATQLTIFSNELSSGGGAFQYPGGNNLSLDFSDRSNPLSQRSIRFAWNGQPTDGTTITYAGMSLMHVPLFRDYTSTVGRNLQASGYTRVTFYARGSLTTYNAVKVEAGGPTAACMTLSVDGTVDECGNARTAQLTGDWQAFSLPVSSAQQSAIKDLFKTTFVFNNPTPGSTAPGQGGVLYLDRIFYQP